MKQKVTLTLARINYPKWLGKRDFINDMKNIVSSHVKFEDKKRGVKFFWVITSVGQQQLDNGEVVFSGELNKIRATRISKVFDEAKWEMKPIPELWGVGESTSRFIIVPKYHVIAFEEKNVISIERFIDVFKGLFVKSLNTFAPEVFSIREGRLIYTIINEWENVQEAKFLKLRIPNPEDLPDFRKAVELLENAGAENSSITFQNEKEGLKVNANSIVDSMIALANRGYGIYEMKGTEKTGEVRKIRQGKYPIKFEIHVEKLEDFVLETITIIKKFLGK
ncbi:MAG: hypothetical protein OIN85_05130 [Candidatus Methanoperedens sp.]|nr:hypothetical protein [Candidatus Methanoperedens sp.]